MGNTQIRIKTLMLNTSQAQKILEITTYYTITPTTATIALKSVKLSSAPSHCSIRITLITQKRHDTLSRIRLFHIPTNK